MVTKGVIIFTANTFGVKFSKTQKQVKMNILTSMARNMTNSFMTLMLAIIPTVFGCGVMSAGQDIQERTALILQA
ncbi:hypothetical protein KIN20_030601 [Parelaphostrongylus tenuis]|uniref:Uncharacterized protein n=1 Tax=Parelaphostrongylus tenuis TaxID=148309 RepID=A0AAD5R531_PARTN|nr:hypothetical protein KIN20_030601 [Parelaphostrongylus tenuis]